LGHGLGSGRPDSGRVESDFRLNIVSFLGFRSGFKFSSSISDFGSFGFGSGRVLDYLISGSFGFFVISGWVGFFFIMFYFRSDWISDRQTLKFFSKFISINVKSKLSVMLLSNNINMSNYFGSSQINFKSKYFIYFINKLKTRYLW
jgi:hypothetical protein